MTYPDPNTPPSYGESYGQQPYPGQGYPQQQYPQQQYAVPAPPTANGGWAVAAIIFFWPVAFVAVSRAFSVYPLWAQGRYAEAQSASDSVKKLGTIALAVAAAVVVLYVIIVVIVAIAASGDTGY